MTSIKPGTSVEEVQNFIKIVYDEKNSRHYSAWDTLSNIQRFSMRSLKGIRKNNYEKTRLNLLITISWFMSFLNRLHIDLEKETWERFPYLCSYCASCPCVCKKTKTQTRKKPKIETKLKPENLKGFQEMFEKIYPSENRTLEHAGIHLAEEVGELSEAFHVFQNNHSNQSFAQVILESADLLSCILGVANSLKINVADELAQMFSNGCHACKKSPCACTFEETAKFKS